MRHLDESALKRLAETTDALDPLPVDALGSVYEDFERRMRDPVPPRAGGAYVRRLAASAIGEDRARRLFAVRTDRDPLDALRGARAATLAELLVEESPQIAASR